MKILVCVKQVPDVEGVAIREGADGAVELETMGGFRMNRFDEFAVETAVCLKETWAGTAIEAISVGPERAAEVLKRAMGMGVDAGIHLQTGPEAGPGPEKVATWIADYARSRKYDLILCGIMSEDGMHGQVGPMLAAHLDLPCATQVMAMSLNPSQSAAAVEREIEGGDREMLNIRLPVLIAVQPGIHRPRYPSLSNLLRANRQGVQTILTDTLTPGAALVDCLGVVLPDRSRASESIVGSAQEKADQLAVILKDKGFLR